MKEKTLYLTYNGLNRPAMVRGVPLMLLLSCGFLATFSGFIAIYFIGVFGLIFPVFFGVFLLGVKVVCENDPNALRVLKLSLSGMLLKLKHGEMITGFDSGRYDER
ncbi:conjugal transfer protein TraD [Salmonella enterica]|nr:conjugal transfer protein TraD [Salmonella enterica]